MRLFAIIGGLLLLVLLAALIAPPYVDWNQFRTRFEQQASLTLGQPVRVRGSTSARLLPLPSVTFSDIQIGDAAEPLLAAESFQIDIELAPLLRGDVTIVDMKLDKPRLDLRVDEDGRLELPGLDEGTQGRLDAADIAIENIAISDGIIRFRDDRFEREFILRDIDAQASARSIAGPWRGDALFTWSGDRNRVDVSTGILRDGNSIRLQLRGEPQAYPYDVAFEGPISFQDGVPELNGILKVSPAAPQSDADRIAFPREAVDRALPVNLESDLVMVPAGARFPAMEIRIGDGDDPYRLTGAGEAVFGETLSFQAEVEGQQFDVDRIAESAEAPISSGKSLANRISAVLAIVERVPKFDADGEVKVRLPAVVSGDTALRDVELTARPLKRGEGWRLRNVSAQLPGRTQLRADGELKLGLEPSYAGELTLASSQPSGLASWLGASASPAIRDLSNAGLSAKARISNSDTVLSDLEILLDGKTLTGRLERHQRPEERPILVADLEGEGVNFDQMSAFFSILTGSGNGGGILAHDLDVALNVDEVKLGSTTARDVQGSIRYSNSNLVVEKLSIVDLEGAAIEADARLADFPANPSGEARGTFKAADPTRLLRRYRAPLLAFGLPARFVDNPDLLAGTDINFRMSPSSEGNGPATLVIDGTAGGSEVDLSGAFSLPVSKIATNLLDVKLVLVNDEPGILLQQVGVPAQRLENGKRAALRISASGVPESGMEVQGALTLADFYISAGGVLDTGLNGTLEVRAEASDLDTAILLSGLPVPGFGEGHSARLAGRLTVEGASAVLDLERARLAEARIAGRIALDTDAKPRPEITAALAYDALDVFALTSLVFQPGTDIPPLLAGLDGTVALTAGRLDLGGELPADLRYVSSAESRMVLRDGDLEFEDIAADWAGGRAGGRIALNRSGEGLGFAGSLALKNGKGQSLSQYFARDPFLSGKVDAAVTFQTASDKAEGFLSSLVGSGTVSIRDGKIEGIDEDAFAGIIEKADATEDDRIADETPALVSKALTAGAFRFGDVELPFTIARGTVRASNVAVSNEKMKVQTDIEYDLTGDNADVDLQLIFAPGRENVTGATPEVLLSVTGPEGNRKTTIDTARFATYLGMRLSERREREFEARKAEILERQRILQTARLYELKAEARRLIKEEQERIERLRIEQEERRKREEERRRREAAEQARLEAELKAAEEKSAREAAAEAGRREARQKEIDELRRRADEAAKRRRDNTGEQELKDFNFTLPPVN